MHVADAGELHRRVQRIIVSYETVGGSRYPAEDALFDIKQAYIETFGNSNQWIVKEKS